MGGLEAGARGQSESAGFIYVLNHGTTLHLVSRVGFSAAIATLYPRGRKRKEGQYRWRSSWISTVVYVCSPSLQREECYS